MTDTCVEPTPLIRLRPPFDDEPCIEDWTLLGGTEPYLKHGPTCIVFQIGYDPDLIAPGQTVSIFVLYALLFYVDQRQSMRRDDLRRLGREAILVFWTLLMDPARRDAVPSEADETGEGEVIYAL